MRAEWAGETLVSIFSRLQHQKINLEARKQAIFIGLNRHHLCFLYLVILYTSMVEMRSLCLSTSLKPRRGVGRGDRIIWTVNSSCNPYLVNAKLGVSEVWKSVGFYHLSCFCINATQTDFDWHFSAGSPGSINPLRRAKMRREGTFGDTWDVRCRKKGRQDWKYGGKWVVKRKSCESRTDSAVLLLILNQFTFGDLANSRKWSICFTPHEVEKCLGQYEMRKSATSRENNQGKEVINKSDPLSGFC